VRSLASAKTQPYGLSQTIYFENYFNEFVVSIQLTVSLSELTALKVPGDHFEAYSPQQPRKPICAFLLFKNVYEQKINMDKEWFKIGQGKDDEYEVDLPGTPEKPGPIRRPSRRPSRRHRSAENTPPMGRRNRAPELLEKRVKKTKRREDGLLKGGVSDGEANNEEKYSKPTNAWSECFPTEKRAGSKLDKLMMDPELLKKKIEGIINKNKKTLAERKYSNNMPKLPSLINTQTNEHAHGPKETGPAKSSEKKGSEDSDGGRAKTGTEDARRKLAHFDAPISPEASISPKGIRWPQPVHINNPPSKFCAFDFSSVKDGFDYPNDDGPCSCDDGDPDCLGEISGTGEHMPFFDLAYLGPCNVYKDNTIDNRDNLIDNRDNTIDKDGFLDYGETEGLTDDLINRLNKIDEANGVGHDREDAGCIPGPKRPLFSEFTTEFSQDLTLEHRYKMASQLDMFEMDIQTFLLEFMRKNSALSTTDYFEYFSDAKINCITNYNRAVKRRARDDVENFDYRSYIEHRGMINTEFKWVGACGGSCGNNGQNGPLETPEELKSLVVITADNPYVVKTFISSRGAIIVILGYYDESGPVYECRFRATKKPRYIEVVSAPICACNGSVDFARDEALKKLADFYIGLVENA